MQNRRDQAQAHAFVMGRLVSALLRAEPDAPITPLRRFLVGALIGVILACLGMVGFGVYGFFVPGGSTAWRTPGALVVEKETGSRYVLVEGVLRPVLNYASARLILGGQPRVVTVSRNSLRDAPRGLPVGIVGAPDYLPDAGQLTGRHWRVCSAVRPDATGKDQPYVILDVRSAPAAGPAADGTQALLVRTPAGQLYLVADGRRLSIPQPATLGALGYAADRASLVGWSWINAVPAGPDLVAEDIPARGLAGQQIEGRATVAGQLFKVAGLDASTPEQYFVMRTDGLSALTPLGAALMLADPATRRSYPGGSPSIAELGRATLAGARMSAISSANDTLPAKPPSPMTVETGQAPCLDLTMSDAGPSVGVSVAVPSAAGIVGGVGAADQVLVRPGVGLLARTLPAPGVADGTLYVLVDTGMRYPIADVEAATALGYPAERAIPVPAPILSLIPSGRPLDIAAARATVDAAPPTTSPSR